MDGWNSINSEVQGEGMNFPKPNGSDSLLMMLFRALNDPFVRTTTRV